MKTVILTAKLIALTAICGCLTVAAYLQVFYGSGYWSKSTAVKVTGVSIAETRFNRSGVYSITATISVVNPSNLNTGVVVTTEKDFGLDWRATQTESERQVFIGRVKASFPEGALRVVREHPVISNSFSLGKTTFAQSLISALAFLFSGGLCAWFSLLLARSAYRLLAGRHA